MSTERVQQKSDDIIEKLFLWAIPKWLTPNHFTYARFALLPIVFHLMNIQEYTWGFTFFVIAACTDFIDGTLARKRDLITDVGKIIDPIADKMLIGLMLYFIGFEYLIVKIFLVFIIFEIFAVLFSGFFAKILGRPMGANAFGKIKMILQSFAVGIFLIGIIFNIEVLIMTSEWTLITALFFAVMAGIEVSRTKLTYLYKKRK